MLKGCLPDRFILQVLGGLCIGLISNPVTYMNIVRGEESPATATSDESASPNAMFEPREYADEQGDVLRYRLMKPLNINPNQRYPLVVFLHGAGERGTDNTAQLVHGMAEFCKAERRAEYPCYVLAPQCPKDNGWAAYDRDQDGIRIKDQPTTEMRLLFQLLDQMLEEAAIDKNRIYITGLSMGGYGTWDAIYRRPNFFAAAAPICGGGDPATVSAFSHLPIWCFHGDQDQAVPVEYSRNMVEALEQLEASPKYTEYQGVGHDSWTQTYASEDFFEWLFAQRRKADLSKEAVRKDN